MKIIKLNQKSVITRKVDTIVGWEDEVVYEPIYVVAGHIESFSWSGNSILKMASGDRIEVGETADEIIQAMSNELIVKLPKLPELGANTEWYQGYAAGAKDMRDSCANGIARVGITARAPS